VSVRRRQLLAVMRNELGGGLSPWRSLWLLLLAFAPTVIIVVHAAHERRCSVSDETLVLAVMMQVFYMRFALFFGCLGIVMRLVRGEMVERNLHYAFLAPVRREVLLVGKFLAGAIAAAAVFGTGILATFLAMYGHSPAGRAFLLSGTAGAHLRAYLLVAVLGSLGYGAVFLALSLVVRNPIVPAIVVLLWEGINGMLPVWLKRFSVTSYLKPLFPVELPVEGFSGLFTVVAEPTPPWVAVTGLLAFVALVVGLACWRIRRIEISYSTD
jgi:ABC-type transport system involved in multi-copper enzyme maturation permease subunit